MLHDHLDLKLALTELIQQAMANIAPDQLDANIVLERPKQAQHGDYASNIAMQLAKPLKRNPRDVAKDLIGDLPPSPHLEKAEIAGPGFINFFLAPIAKQRVVKAILTAGKAYGQNHAPKRERINVEFVSANPTGPLHIGNARGAFVGDLLCRVLEAAGNTATREYYFNDFGGQVQKLGASVRAIRLGRDVPEDGYRGDYVHDLARELPADVAAAAEAATTGTSPEGDGVDAADTAVGRWASERVRAGIEASLDRLGVHFDVWKTESSLHGEGWVGRAVDRLRATGTVYESEGATWFRSTQYGDDKDRVVYRSNGQPTYFAADIGYVTEKFSRGFDRLIYIWGADHHGTVARLLNAADAMGYDRSAVEVLLTAWVRFIRDGQEISMSKRTGEFITLDELLAEIGVDAARWFFASRSPSSGIDFDIELAKKQSSENPVYYVQYAHARIASILRKAADAGVTRSQHVSGGLAGGPEGRLARALIRLPEVVEDAAAGRETQGVTTFATDLATTFHAFYRDARVVDPDEPERSGARLALVDAVRITLANALGQLGISAPESM